jgi:hypothetical protein
LLATLLVLSVLFTAGWAVANAPGRASDEPPATTTVTVVGRYRGVTAPGWAARYRRQTRRLMAARAETHSRWHPTVLYALRLASAVYGVPYRELYAVSDCESHHYPFAVNGQYRGIFQMHWSPFGFSPFDPVASALSAAATVVHDGGWRQWSCKP